MFQDKPEIPQSIPAEKDLVLKAVAVEDANAFHKVITESQKYFAQFDFVAPTFKSLGEVKEVIRDLIEYQASTRGVSYGLWKDKELLGLVTINRIDWDRRNADIGFWLKESAGKQGYAFTALRALINYCWVFFDLKYMTAHAATTNKRAQKLLEKLGFEKGALIKNSITVEDKDIDEYLYRMQKPYNT